MASICGANMGDFVADGLGLSALRGLPMLALVFAAAAVIGQRSKWRSEGPYWLAILTVRTAATNLADLLVSRAGLGYAACAAGLTVLLAAILLGRHGVQQTPSSGGLQDVDGSYWLAMLTAGTLGTVLGDGIGHVVPPMTIGYPIAGLVTSLAVALLLGSRSRTGLTSATGYWTAIVLIRTWGTNIGDIAAYLLSLPVSLLLSGLLLTGLLVIWRGPPEPGLPACSATALMAGRVASSKNAPETPRVVAAKYSLVL